MLDQYFGNDSLEPFECIFMAPLTLFNEAPKCKKCCSVGPIECKFWSNLMEPLNGKRLSKAREHILATERSEGAYISD